MPHSCRYFDMSLLIQVDVSSILAQGCSMTSFLGVDSMKTKDAVWLMSGSLCRTWDSAGLALYQLVCTLLIGAWTCGSYLEPAEVLSNSLTAYFILLHLCSVSRGCSGKWYERSLMNLLTLRHALSLAGHAVQRVLDWPAGLEWSPERSTEKAAESHFGQIKSPWQGTPTVKDLMVSSHHVHAKQSRQSPCVKDARTWQPMPAAGVQGLVKEVFDSPCQFLSALHTATTAFTVAEQLREWYRADGERLLHPKDYNQLLLGGDPDEDEDLSDAEDAQPGAATCVDDEEAERLLGNAQVQKRLQAEIAEVMKSTAAPAAAEDAGSTQKPTATESPRHKKAKGPPKTLPEILAQAGLSKADIGQPGETDDHMLDRLERLLPAIQDCVCSLRAEEGILSRGQIYGCGRLNEQQKLEHQLSVSQRAYVCSEARQSRAQLWSSFQRQCVKSLFCTFIFNFRPVLDHASGC